MEEKERERERDRAAADSKRVRSVLPPPVVAMSLTPALPPSEPRSHSDSCGAAHPHRNGNFQIPRLKLAPDLSGIHLVLLMFNALLPSGHICHRRTDECERGRVHPVESS